MTTPIICKSQSSLSFVRSAASASVVGGHDLREPVIAAKALAVHRLRLALPAAIIWKSQSSLIAANTLPVPQLPFRYPRQQSARTGNRCESFADSPAPASVAGGDNLQEPVIAHRCEHFAGSAASFPLPATMICENRSSPRTRIARIGQRIRLTASLACGNPSHGAGSASHPDLRHSAHRP